MVIGPLSDKKFAVTKTDYEADGAVYDLDLELYENSNSSISINIPRGEIAFITEKKDGTITVEHHNLTLSFPKEYFDKYYEILPSLPIGHQYLSLAEYRLLNPPHFQVYVMDLEQVFSIDRNSLKVDKFDMSTQEMVEAGCREETYGDGWVAFVNPAMLDTTILT